MQQFCTEDMLHLWEKIAQSIAFFCHFIEIVWKRSKTMGI